MLIRHKITLWFIGLSALLLCLFSVYIYLASGNSRKQLFYERLKNKALATKEIYDQHNIVAERIITSIPEQSEYVFDENNKLIFAINDLRDFIFNQEFFKSVNANKELYFEYQGGVKLGYKEGYAFVFGEGIAKRVIAITAYNKTSFEQLQSLQSILLLGNLFFLLAVGLAAFFLSTTAFRPINDLVKQAELVQGHDLDFRLNAKSKDEIGIVASSFNRVLDRIQSLVESQKSFISYASHELRTPLAAINGILETSLKYDNDLEAMLKSQGAARKEIQKAIELVNGLLQLANIESVKGTLEKERLNIVDVLFDVISFFKLKKPEQEFLFEVSDRFSKAAVELDGNSQLLRTAFINLIDNASKYSAMQKIKISLAFASHAKVSVQISDSGIGVLQEDLNFIHDPLFRGKNTQGIDGFGLGLALTYRIVLLHDGEIDIRKNDPQGTIAEVTLPVSGNSSDLLLTHF
jgi:signal transduction histidine kinase